MIYSKVIPMVVELTWRLKKRVKKRLFSPFQGLFQYVQLLIELGHLLAFG